MAEEKKYPGDYIPDDHPDLEKRHKKRIKSKEITDKIVDLIPFKSKKFKKSIKEEQDRPIKKNVTKALEDMYINLKSKKMTKTEGSFAKGGRAGYSVGGKAIKGVSKILIK